MQRRLERFDAKLAQSGLDALLVTGQKNIYYLTDFWGTNATVFITKNRRLFLTDSRYTLIAKQSVHGFDIIEEVRIHLRILLKLSRLITLKQSVLIIRCHLLTTKVFSDFLKATLCHHKQLHGRVAYDQGRKELATIRKACSISDRAFTDVLDFIKPGQTTELQVANFLDFRMREYGASGISFEDIIASGYRSAMPHGVASEKGYPIW